MGRSIILLLPLLLIVFGAGYLLYTMGKRKGMSQTGQTPNNRGLWAAIAAIAVGVLLLFRNSRK